MCLSTNRSCNRSLAVKAHLESCSFRIKFVKNNPELGVPIILNLSRTNHLNTMIAFCTISNFFSDNR